MSKYHVSVHRSFTTYFRWELWCDGKIIKDGEEPTARAARKEGEGWLRIHKERDNEMKTYNDIGIIAVVPEGTTNPYTAKSIVGKERSEALRRFLKEDELVPGYDFWIAPTSGGAKRIHTPQEANVDPDVIEYYWGEEGIRNVHRPIRR